MGADGRRVLSDLFPHSSASARRRRTGGADELLPYAFFESVLIGADFTEMLSEELKEKSEHIQAFLGDFIDVTLTEDPKTCGLVRKKKERLYELRYFTAEVKQGKVVDIQG